jgi:patatin-like phospholipase/acyl hydrolase
MKTILSIDGGGVRGIIPLACLVRLETQEGKPSNQLFDMVAGTSTGAIIAAGIALGISARGLLALYRDLAYKAFQRLPWWEILFNLGNHRFSNDFVAASLSELGAEVPINELNIDILLTAKNTRTSRTDFFVRDQPGNANLWGMLPLKDAVLASIAAPTYFPAHRTEYQGEDYTWVDGGVGVAGNPCYHAAVEAIHYTDGSYIPGQTFMLSFGTGRRPHPIDATKANMLQWGLWSLAELQEDVAEWQTYITHREYDLTGRIDFRRYQLDLAPDIMEILNVIVPPGMDVSTIGMDAVWAVDLLDEIGRSFANEIDFTNPDGLVLKTALV